MLRRFGWLYRVLGFGRSLRQLRFEDHSADQVRVAAEAGPVLYVLLHQSSADYLALNTVLNARRLPLSVWSNGPATFWWQPVVAAWRDVAYRARAFLLGGRAADAVMSGWLSRTVANGESAVVFLNEPQPYWERLLGYTRPDPLDAILDAQDVCRRSIQLVPILVVWNRAPEKTGSQVRRFLSSAGGPPSWLAQLGNIWFRSADGFLQAGTAVDLREFMDRVPDPLKRVPALRTLLRRYLSRESQLIRGPRLMSRDVMKRIVLDTPPMRQLARDEAQALGKTETQVLREQARAFESIAANFSWWTIRALYILLRPLWTRVFAGVDARPEDIEAIREAMRTGTAVIVPCHKSHFDYVLMSWFLYEHDMVVPHVVAGMNLAIWPISIILRGAGGFFIKRSFAGERIFPAVFARYLRELIRQGYPVEFFPEGGRSRTGKLLPPRVGVLGMVMDAAAVRRRDREVVLLPIALAYEQVAEEGVYAEEIKGQPKQAESVGQLVKARSVLWRRYGRVYLRVGTPIPCSEVVDGGDGRLPWSARDRGSQKRELLEVGERILYRIHRATVVLPTSLVSAGLLAHHRQGIRHRELLDRLVRFQTFLSRQGAQEAASLSVFEEAVTKALDRFLNNRRIRSFQNDGERIWSVEPDERITLEFYKNQLLNFFAPAGLAACAIRGLEDLPQTMDAMRPGFCFLVWCWRKEFRLDPDQSATHLLRQGLADLVAHGALECEGDRFRVCSSERMGEIYGLFRPFLEAYTVVLRQGSTHLPKRIGARDLARIFQGEADNYMAAGLITRPEALSLVTLKNAVDVFREDGIYLDEDGRISETVHLRDAALAWLGPMVD